MESIFKLGQIFSLAVLLSACSDSERTPGSTSSGDSKEVMTLMSQAVVEDCAEFGCPNGCVQIDYGVDDNADGSLDAAEIDGTEYICNGSNGQDGADGMAGQDGQDGVDGAQGAPGADGTDGQDGAQGAPGADGTNGQDGAQGEPGEPGEVTCTDTDNGATDNGGDTCSAYVNSPSWCGNYDDDDFQSNEMCCACGGGAQGPQGPQGEPGTDGEDGADGTNGTNGEDGQDGTNGTNGTDGAAGADGSDCTVSAVDCVATLTCEDGTSVSWNLMGCMPEVPEGMVEVPAGDFLYGDPTTSIYLPTFYIDQYEVSAGDYKACVDAGVCQYNGSTTSEYRTYNNGRDTHPINYVNWYEATAYCIFNGKRLPTEQEWEKAARGTDGRTYPWGNESPTCDLAWSAGCPGDTQPVGGLTAGASPYGAYDMAGNVWEWTNSWYSSDMDYRVLRGGSFIYDSSYLLSSLRLNVNPGYRGDGYGFGFRCAQ